MFGLPVVEDTRAKGSYGTFCIKSDGQFVGYKFGPHKRIPYFANAEMRNCLQFIACKNRSSSGTGFLCAASNQPFKEVPEDSYMSCFLILLQGVFYCKTTHQFKVAFHRWVGHEDKSLDISSVVRSHNSTLSFAKMMFDNNLTVANVSSMYLQYLNQITGPKLRGWKTKLNISIEGTKKFYQSALQPDSWLRTPLCDVPSYIKFIKLGNSTKVDNWSTSHNKSDTAKAFGAPPLTQWNCKSKSVVLYCLRRTRLGDCCGFFLQPIPTDRHDKVQKFARITRTQAKYIDDFFKKKVQIHGVDYVMDSNVFTKFMIQMMKENGSDGFVDVTKLVVGVVKNYIVSVIKKESDIPRKDSIVRMSDTIWRECIPRNVRDYDIAGTVVFRGFPWIFKKLLNKDVFLLMHNVYFGKGLKRSRTKQLGSFFMNGFRQSSAASGSMGEAPGNTISHHYWDSASMQTSLLPLAQSMINQISEEAIQTQNGCGEVMMNLIRKALLVHDEWKVESKDICPYNILSNNFCCTGHKDGDTLSDKHTKVVKKYTEMCGCQKLHNFLETMMTTFPEETKKFPLPTTCCWVPVEMDVDLIHIQYFVLLDFDLGFDVSSDIFSELCQQVGATFYGSLTGHLTSRSLWVTPDGSGVTLCCPGRSYNFAWGRSGGANGLSVGEHEDDVVRETWGDTY